LLQHRGDSTTIIHFFFLISSFAYKFCKLSGNITIISQKIIAKALFMGLLRQAKANDVFRITTQDGLLFFFLVTFWIRQNRITGLSPQGNWNHDFLPFLPGAY
jgi:hypothetical protein